MGKRDAVEKRVGEAIKLFWLTRDKQNESQGVKTGQKDAGLRAAVTGGKHLDGFTDICRDLFIKAGVPEAHVFWRDRRELPGYYRAENNWDLIVVADGHLLAVIEFKAQVGPSFGNNFNNRTEEALGNASDLWAAYREGASSRRLDRGSGTCSSSKTAINRIAPSRSSSRTSTCSQSFRAHHTLSATSFF